LRGQKHHAGLKGQGLKEQKADESLPQGPINPNRVNVWTGDESLSQNKNKNKPKKRKDEERGEIPAKHTKSDRVRRCLLKGGERIKKNSIIKGIHGG